jgi:superfamily II DNA or RNA helicase
MSRSLRPYQVTALSSVHEAWTIYRSTLLVLATGCGKTFTAASILRDRARHGRILWIAHRRELITQAKEALESVGLGCEIEMAQDWAKLHAHDLFGIGASCVIASVQTLTGARLRRFRQDSFATIVIDEAHHATAASYREITEQFPEAKILGLTATPDRGDGVGLKSVFDCVAFEYGIREAITEGFLAPIVQKRIECADLDISDVKTKAGDLAQGELERAMSTDAVLHQVAAPLVEHAGQRSTIVFTAGVEQAHALADVMAGYTEAKCAAIDGTTPDELRARYLGAFARGELQFLFNCAVLTEGFDAPRTACIAIARPTKSRALYTQMVGRGTRLFEGKKDCLVLDFVGNSGRHKLVNPLDILEGKPIPDDVREAAEKKTKAGMPSLEALEAAKQEAIARAEKAERERLRKAKLKADVAHRAQLVDPFGVTHEGDRSGPRASDGQVGALVKFGVTEEQAGNMSKREASKMIDELMTRSRRGLCSYKQARQMAKHGLRTDLTRAEAGAVMDGLSKNGWKPLPEHVARFGVRSHEAAE